MMGLTLYRRSGVCVGPDGECDAHATVAGGGGGVMEVKWRYRHISKKRSLGIRSAMGRKVYRSLQYIRSWGCQLIPISRANPSNTQMSSSLMSLHFTSTTSPRTFAAYVFVSSTSTRTSATEKNNLKNPTAGRGG